MEVYTSTKLSGMGEIFRIINTSILILIIMLAVLLLIILIAYVKKHLDKSNNRVEGRSFKRKGTKNKD